MYNRPVQSLEEKVTNFVKCVQRRNIREIMLAAFIMAVFALDIIYAIYSQRKDTLSVIGSGAVILASLLIVITIWWKLHIPKSELYTFPPTQFPDKWKHHLSNQARMLRLVWLWYLLPLFIGVSLYLLSFYDSSFSNVIIPLLIEIIAFATIWQFNLKVAKQIERDRDAWFNTSDVGWHSLNNS